MSPSVIGFLYLSRWIEAVARSGAIPCQQPSTEPPRLATREQMQLRSAPLAQKPTLLPAGRRQKRPGGQSVITNPPHSGAKSAQKASSGEAPVQQRSPSSHGLLGAPSGFGSAAVDRTTAAGDARADAGALRCGGAVAEATPLRSQTDPPAHAGRHREAATLGKEIGAERILGC